MTGSPAGDVRPATWEDLPALAALERASFDSPWSQDLLRLELVEQASVLLVKDRVDGGLAGYAAFRVAADEAELLRTAVAPGERRRGIARVLVEAGLRAVAERGARCCFLEVRPRNAAAVALYRSLGFRDAGRREGYYSDGSDALVMVRRGLPPPP